ncbi:MAG: Hpt domain-containing protein [Cryomorphaceae bacterium]
MSEHIDVNGLLNLSGNDREFVAEILKLYIQKTNSDIRELGNAAGEENWKSVAFILHRMRSSATPLGLVELQKNLKALEIDLKDHNTSDADNRLNHIIDRVKTAQKSAENQLQQLLD